MPGEPSYCFFLLEILLPVVSPVCGFCARLCLPLRSLALCLVCRVARGVVSGWRAFSSFAVCNDAYCYREGNSLYPYRERRNTRSAARESPHRTTQTKGNELTYSVTDTSTHSCLVDASAGTCGLLASCLVFTAPCVSLVRCPGSGLVSVDFLDAFCGLLAGS
jgi:hypothetical protein